MPNDFDDYGGHDEFDDVDEDDMDPSDYEQMWGGPEDEDLEDGYESQGEGENGFDEGDYPPEDFESFANPLHAPRSGDEASAEQHFATLKQKYKAESVSDTSPLNPLYKILLRLESNEQLDNNDISWLRRNRVRGPIHFYATREALACEQRFKTTGDGWAAVLASSFWRTAEEPRKALAATEGLIEDCGTNYKLKSGVLTTRGGAFRDQGCLDEAEECGQQAILLSQQNFRPYMLLGAVCYQKGDPQRGDEYFATAKKLGADLKNQDSEIKRAVMHAGVKQQRIVAQYLLLKDPLRYCWAEKYL